MFDRTKPDGQLDVTRRHARETLASAAPISARTGAHHQCTEPTGTAADVASRERLFFQSIVLAGSGGHWPVAHRTGRGSRQPARVRGHGGGRAAAARGWPLRSDAVAGDARDAARRDDSPLERDTFRAGPLFGARRQLPELLRLGQSRRLRRGPPRHRRLADRSADHRPGRAVDCTPDGRALRVSVRRHLSRSRLPHRDLSAPDGRPRARPREPVLAARSRRGRRPGRADVPAAGRGKRRRPLTRPCHPQLGRLRRDRSRREGQPFQP